MIEVQGVLKLLEFVGECLVINFVAKDFDNNGLRPLRIESCFSRSKNGNEVIIALSCHCYFIVHVELLVKALCYRSA